MFRIFEIKLLYYDIKNAHKVSESHFLSRNNDLVLKVKVQQQSNSITMSNVPISYFIATLLILSPIQFESIGETDNLDC